MKPLAASRGVRIRPGRVLVHVACLAVLLLGACSRQQVLAPEPYTPTASPVPTSSIGCGLQSLPASCTHGVYARRLSGGDRIDVATTAADGSGPMPWPVLYDGVVYVHVVSTGGANPRLLAVDLAGGTRSEWSVPSERGPMVRWGDLLVWQSASGVSAFDVRSHRIVDVPQSSRPSAIRCWCPPTGRRSSGRATAARAAG